MPGQKEEKFIPAARFHWLTSLFEPVTRLVSWESKFLRPLMERAGIKNGHRVLDVGCGPAALAILIKQAYPDSEVGGVDIDPKVLKIAENNVANAGVNVTLTLASATGLPFPDGTFDRVISSFAFHHLDLQQKKTALREILRVLQPAGEAHILDFGKPQDWLMFLFSRPMRPFEKVGDNMKGLIPGLFQEAGFIDVAESARFKTIIGTISIFEGKKPGVSQSFDTPA